MAKYELCCSMRSFAKHDNVPVISQLIQFFCIYGSKVYHCFSKIFDGLLQHCSILVLFPPEVLFSYSSHIVTNIGIHFFVDKTIKLWKVTERDRKPEGFNLKDDTGILRDPSSIHALVVSQYSGSIVWEVSQLCPVSIVFEVWPPRLKLWSGGWT